MTKRVSSTLLAMIVMTAMAIGPAAAQSFDGEILVAAPSADEVCNLLEELGDDLAALEELAAAFEQLAGFEPELVDDADYADLGDALEGVLDANDGAWGVTAIYDGDVLLVSVIPDLSDCDAVDQADLMGPDMEPGTYLVQPSLDEYCALIEDALEDLEEELNGDPGDNGDLGDNGDVGNGDLGDLEGFLPEPVTGDDAAAYIPVADALDALLAAEDDADEATASLADDTLVIVLLPAAERCDVDDVIDDVVDEEVDEDEEDIPVPSEVRAGVSPSSSGLPLMPALALALLLGAVLLAGGAIAHRRST